MRMRRASQARVLPGQRSSGPSPLALTPTSRLTTAPNLQRPPCGAAGRRPSSRRRHRSVKVGQCACLRRVRAAPAQPGVGTGGRAPSAELAARRLPRCSRRVCLPSRLGNRLPPGHSVAYGGHPASVGSASVSSRWPFAAGNNA